MVIWLFVIHGSTLALYHVLKHCFNSFKVLWRLFAISWIWFSRALADVAASINHECWAQEGEETQMFSHYVAGLSTPSLLLNCLWFKCLLVQSYCILNEDRVDRPTIEHLVGYQTIAC